MVKLALLFTPLFLILYWWISFKISYYGDFLPNTFYVKADGGGSIKRGFYYVSSFLENYGLYLFIVLLIAYFKTLIKKSKEYILIIALIALWFMYVIKVSGDFMEYRFLVPIIPLLFTVFSLIIINTKNNYLQKVLIVYLISMSIYHSLSFKTVREIESIKDLHDHVFRDDQSWKQTGESLKKYFGDVKPTIATSAAGAIPYYSEMKTIDMLGLNDKNIPKTGLTFDDRPGHSVYVTMEYLMETDVNFVIGHPFIRPKESHPVVNIQDFFFEELNFSLVDSNVKVIEMPINDNYNITMLYLNQDDKIDKIIEKENFINYHLDSKVLNNFHKIGN